MRYILGFFLLFYSVSAWAQTLQIADKAQFEVEVAKTPEQLQRGLMFVKKLPENRGMLFDLRAYPKASMWMKNTYVPLDMLFVDCNFNVVDIYPNAKPQSLDKISSAKDFCYVVEILGGSAQKYNLWVGDKLFLNPSM